ncbi:ATP-binding protein [Roseburia sp. 499]|uniref:ATP-binding protein n=1 Tax=Roseburia sp. 499 TaxID=1261634 RepID=UPI000952642D|nr:ATP-binding protein [Roseburia sp. 499]WVK70546.1 ATP-binding protein [Roseburia sp. 499]
MENIDITCEELRKLEKDTYVLVDIRDESAVNYGTLPEAIHIPQEQLTAENTKLPKEKKLVLYCTKGIFSKEKAEELCEAGYQAYSLTGGYTGWLLAHMKETEKREEHSAEEIEKSIRKKFHKQLFSRFAKAVRDYELVQEGDKIAVCISGGKDSMLMAKLFQELKKHNKVSFELEFLVMDPGYSEANRQVIENNAKRMNIPITVFESDIFDAVYDIEKSPCYLCARMRRGHLYNKAKELGCNKIALGHHYDDVIETILMGMLYGAQVQTMMPKLHSTNFEGMELIRPMYYIREDDIKHWRDYNDLHFIQCACRFTDTCTTCDPDGRSVSKRMEVKNMIAEMKKINPFVESNIFKSVENVNLSTVIAYKKDGVKHHFLEEYE